MDVAEAGFAEVAFDPVLRGGVARRADIAAPEGGAGIAVFIGDGDDFVENGFHADAVDVFIPGVFGTQRNVDEGIFADVAGGIDEGLAERVGWNSGARTANGTVLREKGKAGGGQEDGEFVSDEHGIGSRQVCQSRFDVASSGIAESTLTHYAPRTTDAGTTRLTRAGLAFGHHGE